jgi:hypothetical protein
MLLNGTPIGELCLQELSPFNALLNCCAESTISLTTKSSSPSVAMQLTFQPAQCM